MDRFEWRMPYSDGFNPSIVPLNDPALTPSIDCMHDIFGREAVGGMVLAFLRFGDSQCSYHDNAKTKEKFNINTNGWIGHGKRKGLEPTIAVFLDSNLEWVAQSIVMVELDAEWGVGKEHGAREERTKMHKLSDSDSGESKYKFAHVAKRLDDIRAFVRDGAIWISYYGPDHGFDNGNIVMSKVHFDRSATDSSKVYLYIKASEVEVVCCGRNVALFHDTSGKKLKGVTWVDPLTVEDIEPDNPLRSSVDKGSSSIHGTNDNMIQLPGTSELLGVAHFHRPKHIKIPCWDDSTQETCQHAPYGHHYTHAFFTITDKPPYVIRRVSNEFMFPSTKANNPHIIQFASGLSIVKNHVLISYGINDCEPALIQLPIAEVDTLLLDVKPGTEVRDLMAELEHEKMENGNKGPRLTKPTDMKANLTKKVDQNSTPETSKQVMRGEKARNNDFKSLSTGQQKQQSHERPVMNYDSASKKNPISRRNKCQSLTVGTHHKTGTSLSMKLFREICGGSVDKGAVKHFSWNVEPSDVAIGSPFVYFIRDPLEVVVSSYQYHIKDTTTEKWLFDTGHQERLRNASVKEGLELEWARTIQDAIPKMRKMFKYLKEKQQMSNTYIVRLDEIREENDFRAFVRKLQSWLGLVDPVPVEDLVRCCFAGNKSLKHATDPDKKENLRKLVLASHSAEINAWRLELDFDPTGMRSLTSHKTPSHQHDGSIALEHSSTQQTKKPSCDGSNCKPLGSLIGKQPIVVLKLPRTGFTWISTKITETSPHHSLKGEITNIVQGQDIQSICQNAIKRAKDAIKEGGFTLNPTKHGFTEIMPGSDHSCWDDIAKSIKTEKPFVLVWRRYNVVSQAVSAMISEHINQFKICPHPWYLEDCKEGRELQISLEPVELLIRCRRYERQGVDLYRYASQISSGSVYELSFEDLVDATNGHGLSDESLNLIPRRVQIDEHGQGIVERVNHNYLLKGGTPRLMSRISNFWEVKKYVEKHAPDLVHYLMEPNYDSKQNGHSETINKEVLIRKQFPSAPQQQSDTMFQGQRQQQDQVGGTLAVVHMGPHKTGSTTIQSRSVSLKDQLKLDGFEMPWTVMRERNRTLASGWRRDQAEFAHCFSSYWKNDECQPELLKYGKEIAARNRNLFVSAEFFDSIDDTGVEELAQYMSQWQKQTIILFYRRYYDWIASDYNQATKSRDINDTEKWQSSILDRVHRVIDNVPWKHITKLEERLRKRFDNVNVLNFHDKSKGPDVALFCDPALNMKRTCKAIQNDKDSMHENTRFNLDYTDLAYGAKISGLVKIETNERMQQVAQALQDHHVHFLNGTTLKRVCPPQEDLDKLLDMSLTFELMYFPHQVGSLRADFAKQAGTKLCKVDVDYVLKDKQWREFVVSLSKE